MRIFITGGSGFIGTNAVSAFAAAGHELLNYSAQAPLDSGQNAWWREGDILDQVATTTAIQEFQPDWALHLAARAECDENTTIEKGYRVNTDGTQNVLQAIRATPSVQRAIITSTQFVCGPGRVPQHDEDYFPVTIYGGSKIITEKLTRVAELACCWTIVRPTNVWGPWHLRYRREFWRVLQRGLYIHPGRQPVIRSYGYVKNVVDQMRRIFEAPATQVSERTLYLGDRPANLLEWVNGFSRALAGREVRIVPRPLMKLVARVGDIPTRLTGRAFLINSSRYRSMITDYDTPMQPTFDLLGENPYSLAEGIDETIAWLGSYKGTDRAAGGA
ncbi:MAG: NAD-dependent epimerase/dehydratase family protein [Chthoniobacterales bacterium]